MSPHEAMKITIVTLGLIACGSAPPSKAPTTTTTSARAKDDGAPCPASPAISLTVGRFGDTCVALADGHACCWGYNQSGSLGVGEWAGDWVDQPKVVQGIDHVVQVHAETDHACARRDDGTVWCWGDNEKGLTGLGTQTGRAKPTPVPGLSNVVDLEVMGDAACVLQSDGAVKCWGENGWGTLGTGTGANSATPVAVAGLTDAVSLSCRGGFGYCCATRKIGTVSCWGQRINKKEPRSVPVEVPGVRTAKRVVVDGEFGHPSIGCATLEDGNIVCWGDNVFGEFGSIGTTLASATPVPELANARQVALSYSGVMWIDKDGNVFARGNNVHEHFGLGAQWTGAHKLVPTPQAVPAYAGTVELVMAETRSCARLATGAVMCAPTGGAGSKGSPLPSLVAGLGPSGKASPPAQDFDGIPLPNDATRDTSAGVPAFNVPRAHDAVVAELRQLLAAGGWTIAKESAAAWEIRKGGRVIALLVVGTVTQTSISVIDGRKM